jgi:hypothetical protein
MGERPRRDRLIVAWHEYVFSVGVRGPKGLCPEGAERLSPGFQPRESPRRRRALKGRQIEA